MGLFKHTLAVLAHEIEVFDSLPGNMIFMLLEEVVLEKQKAKNKKEGININICVLLQMLQLVTPENCQGKYLNSWDFQIIGKVAH